MNRDEFLRALQKLLNGQLTVSRETVERFQTYHDLLLKWQKVQNLVAPNTLSEIWFRHFLDSAQLAPALFSHAKVVENYPLQVVDMGAGAGFPGLVLAILTLDFKEQLDIKPDQEGPGALFIHLIEANGRKCAFLKDVARTLGLNVEIHNCRIEDFANQSTIPHIDFVTARALKPLSQLLELGHFAFSLGAEGLFLKGKAFEEELEVAAKSWAFEVETFESCTEAGARIVRIRTVKPRR